jgi:drug/metabolite transporter (DMT)-like permease
VTTLALIAIFSSAVFHAAWNALLKKMHDPAAASIVIVIALFHEVVDMRSGAGALLLGAGLLALVQGASSFRGLAAAAGCALAIALYPLGYKRALQAGVDPYPLFAMSLGLALPVQLALLRTDRVARLGAAWQRAPWRLSLAAALCAASFLLFLVALQENGPGRVTALRNSSVLFATLFGWWGGDRMTARAASSAVLVAAGAVLLSWN